MVSKKAFFLVDTVPQKWDCGMAVSLAKSGPSHWLSHDTPAFRSPFWLAAVVLGPWPIPAAVSVHLHLCALSLATTSTCACHMSAAAAALKTLTDLKSHSKELTAALKRARAKSRRTDKSDKLQSEARLALGVGILALCAPDEECVLQYCRGCNDLEEESQTLRTEIVNKFLSTSVDKLVRLLTPASDAEKTAYIKAARYKTNWQVKSWIASMNKKGVAPSWADTIMYRLRLLRREATSSGIDVCGSGKNSGQKSWLLRFKHKWSIKRGCPLTRDLDPLAVRREKVGAEKWTSLGPENQRGPQNE